MCGILGIFNYKKSVDSNTLCDMQSVIKHRGPDDSGLEIFNFFSDDRSIKDVGIAFDRLSIRDLSINGHQPMYSKDKDVMIAFNGEIYNSEELRPRLLKKNIIFQSNTDTEVLLYLYKEYGIDQTLALVDGMFAICIVDFSKKVIYLCRDRLGEKPLYYHKQKESLIFASEYKAFFKHPSFHAEIDENALHEYFIFRYTAGHHTILKDVYNVKPGHYIKITKTNIKEHEYWKIPSKRCNGYSFEENKENLKQLIDKSVKRRLISDRPIGIQLSGGVDSSYLAHVVSTCINRPLETFGITFENKDFSEEKYIDIVNEKLGSNYHKYLFKAEDFLDTWIRGTYYFEAPMNHEGTLALYILNKSAKKHVDVMLAGDGPDESMGGYGRFPQISYDLNIMDKSYIKSILRKPYYKLKGTRYDDYPFTDNKFISLSRFIDDDVFCDLKPAGGNKKSINRVFHKRRKILEKTSGKGLRKYMNYEMSTYMQEILMRTDKISMASSIEVRVPYIMPELIEYITTIPDNQLVRDFSDKIGERSKWILKELCKDVYGQKFSYRPKVGFGFPMWDFFTNTIVENFIENTLIPNLKKRNLFNMEYVMECWNQRHCYKAQKWSSHLSSVQNMLWCVFSFEIWAETFMDNIIKNNN